MQLSIILFLSNLFSTDMLVIVFFALLLFGGEKLPEIARTLGKGLRDFKSASEDVKREINNQINSFEEKREDKKLDEIAASHQVAAQNPPVSENAFQPVANTVPVADTVPVAETHETGYSEPENEKHLTENHLVESHVHSDTIIEPSKNS